MNSMRSTQAVNFTINNSNSDESLNSKSEIIDAIKKSSIEMNNAAEAIKEMSVNFNGAISKIEKVAASLEDNASLMKKAVISMEKAVDSMNDNTSSIKNLTKVIFQLINEKKNK